MCNSCSVKWSCSYPLPCVSPLLLADIPFYWLGLDTVQGQSGRIELTVGPKQTMGQVVSWYLATGIKVA